MLLESLFPFVGWFLSELLVDVSQMLDSEITKCVSRWTDKRQFASHCENDDEIAIPFDIRHAVRDAHHRFPGIRDLAEKLHHFPVGLLIQSAGHFIEKQQTRLPVVSVTRLCSEGRGCCAANHGEHNSVSASSTTPHAERSKAVTFSRPAYQN